MLDINQFYTIYNFIKNKGWFDEYNFWLLGSFPNIINGNLKHSFDIDIAFVHKDNCHNKNKIKQIIKQCNDAMSHIKIDINNIPDKYRVRGIDLKLEKKSILDIYYRPNLNKDLQERGLDTIWTSNQFWGDKSSWPTRQNYQAWRVKNFQPLELWYLKNNQLDIYFKLWPSEKHIERVIDGHIYEKPILLNNYNKEEK